MYISLILIIIAYFFGSFPSGLVLSRILKLDDIRNYGSNNIGATNAVRVHGKKFGILVLTLDILKTVIPLLLSIILIKDLDYAIFNIKILHINFIISKELIVYFIALTAILGHIFPIWLKFKGGKAIASSLGVILVLNWQLFIIILLSWIVIFLITKISSLSSLTSFFIGTISAFTLNTDSYFPYFMVILFIIILIKHRTNIKNLILKKEYKFTKA